MSTPKKGTKAQEQPEQIQNPSANPNNIEFYIKHIANAVSCLHIIEHSEEQIKAALLNASAKDYESYYVGLEIVAERAELLHDICFDESIIAQRLAGLADT